MDSKLITMINIIHIKNWFYLNNDIIDIQFSFHLIQHFAYIISVILSRNIDFL